MPLDMRDATDKDQKRYGDDARRVITSWNLMEFSVVPVPANQDALALEVSKSSGFLKEAWSLPTISPKLVVPRRVFCVSDSGTKQRREVAIVADLPQAKKLGRANAFSSKGKKR